LALQADPMSINRLIKPINAIKTGFSYCLSRINGHSVLSGMPVAAGIEISGHCNLSCPECYSGSGIMSRKRGFMDIELFRKIINDLRSYLYNINLYFQGEPMLHPRFFDFLEISSCLKTTISTNGHFLSEENAEKLARSGLNRIIVSLDGMDSATYSLYRRGGNFENVISGIINVSDAIRNTRSSLKLEIQFLVNRQNEAQITSICRFSKELRAKLRLKSMQIINNKQIDYWMPVNEKYRRYIKKNSHYIVKSAFHNHCLRLWLNPVVTYDGMVVPCCFDKNADHVMGDLNENCFKEIWYGEKYKIFRDSVLNDRKSIEICRNCTSGLYGVRF
jgi:radical SAM protein with 4Fe4S-binding SPASM domain